MKNLLSFLLLTVFSFQSIQSQVRDTTAFQAEQKSYEYHIKKQQENRTIASMALGGGLLLTGVGIAVAANNMDFSGMWTGGQSTSSNKGGIEDGLVILGLASTVASVPLFIIAGSHGKKAQAALKTGAVSFNNHQVRGSQGIHVGITIDL